ncbi:MAG: hypothetical protein A2092_00415 [Rhodobacteraceae bacterium GWE1_64_9]|nr:MAG: hypothetical protein A2092_00415 [Rhodobacteraceae bacterium GWE1_64_9]OHC51093.1 MAG: hypothetical protein A2X69_19240 [Rhodobacteraceae bacterium GWF1_65_7]HBD89380.1 extensin family protein [Gemmobacter sp.]
MKMAVALALGLAFVAGGASANGLGTSPHPKPRPGSAAVTIPLADPMVATVSTANAPVLAPVMRPRPRPENLIVALAPVAEPVIDEASVVDLAGAVRPPPPRPGDLAAAVEETPKRKGWGIFKAAAVRNPQSKESLMPKKGSVCGDPSIRGETLARVVSKVKGCGIEDPVKVTAIAGVKLSQPATITCETALATKSWIEKGVQPAFGKDPVKVLQIAGSYVCRPRNGIRGNKVSEHGRGKAIDVSGFTLTSGKTLSIQGDWRKYKTIKASHKAACGIFGTTLGPGSDGHHEDHLHFDVASHRNGAYCR